MSKIRTIDANALKEELARHEPTIIFNRNYDGLLADIIDKAPTFEPIGGELTVRGFQCANCGFFRRKRFGKSKFCEECGSRMRGDNK